jgi:hypothetical protein
LASAITILGWNAVKAHLPPNFVEVTEIDHIRPNRFKQNSGKTKKLLARGLPSRSALRLPSWWRTSKYGLINERASLGGIEAKKTASLRVNPAELGAFLPSKP